MRLNEFHDLFVLIHKRRRYSSQYSVLNFMNQSGMEDYAQINIPWQILSWIETFIVLYKINIESIDSKRDFSTREIYGLDFALA